MVRTTACGRILQAFIAFVVLATPAAAEEPWEYRITPYLWAPSLSMGGSIASGPAFEGETSVLEVLDFAALLAGEVRKGDWALLTEFNYLALSGDAALAGGSTLAGTELAGVMGGAAVSYRAFQNETTSLETFGGFRVWSLETTIDPPSTPAVSSKTTFVDPILGLRARHAVTDRVSVTALAEIGGFGVGSDLQWEAILRADYALTERYAVGVGYRHLALHFDRSRSDIDLVLTGPFLALDIGF